MSKNNKRPAREIKTVELDAIELPAWLKPSERIYVNLNGRDITAITKKASAEEGWAIVAVTDGNSLPLRDMDGETYTARLEGDVTIIKESLATRVEF